MCAERAQERRGDFVPERLSCGRGVRACVRGRGAGRPCPTVRAAPGGAPACRAPAADVGQAEGLRVGGWPLGLGPHRHAAGRPWDVCAWTARLQAD